MSARGETGASGPSATLALPVAVAGGSRAADPPCVPGRLLGRLSVLPALLAMAWLLTGLPLLMLGHFTLPLMLVVSVPLAAGGAVLGLRWIPDRWQGTLPEPGLWQARTPWWAVVGVLAVAVAFDADQMIFHSQQIIIFRDPASYIEFAAWISRHGSLPIPQSLAAFGGTHHVLTFNSPAYYQVGSTIVPQFMAGLPMVLAAGFWAGGASAAVMVAPVLGALAVLTFGGLAARLAGPRWAPLAALVLALSWPEQYTSRSTFSEPLAQILFLGGLCLVIDSLAASCAAARVTAALGGLALGLSILARIDGISDILMVVPYCGMLLLSRRPQAVPLFGGVVAGALFGVTDGLVLSRPYLNHVGNSLLPLLVAVVLVVAAVAVAVAVRWDDGMPRLRPRWLLRAAVAVPFAAVILFAIRPYVVPVRARGLPPTHANDIWQAYYFQFSLHWVVWYIGVPAVALGAAGAALLARRCLHDQAPAWTLPLVTFGWIILSVLYRPSIVPIQPWASRRLVPAVLPGFILLAAWSVNWLVNRARRSGYDSRTSGALIVLCAGMLLGPAVVTTFGLGLRDGGPLGIQPAADGMAFKPTEAGEIAAVHRMCAAIPHGASVVMIGGKVSGRLTEVVRGMCGDPTAILHHPQVTSVDQVVHGIEQAGRRPVLLANARSELTRYGNVIKPIMLLHTKQEQSGTGIPRDTTGLVIDVWMLEPAS
jgi:hypothetical protein